MIRVFAYACVLCVYRGDDATRGCPRAGLIVCVTAIGIDFLRQNKY